MAIERKNFSGQATPSAVDTIYRECNFSQPVPGTQLFPGDDTPRIFIDCNLVNALPPAGSTVRRCNTTQVRRSLEVGEEVVRVGDRDATVKRYADRILGRLNPETLALESKQRDIPVDPPDGTRDARIAALVREKAEQVAKEAEIAERETALRDEIIAEPIEREVIR